MRKTIGFAVLSLFTIVLFASSVVNMASIHPGYMLVFLVFMIFASAAALEEFKAFPSFKESFAFLSRPALAHGLATTSGALVTYFVSVYLGVGGVLASGSVGLLGALFFKPYAVGIFCGSFLGMTSPELLNLPIYFAASMFVGLLFVVVKDVFNGYGGKLGTTALSAAMIITLLSGTPFLESVAFDNFEQFLIVGFSVAGALVTFILNIHGNLGPVKASAIVGIISGVLFPLLYPQMGEVLAIVVFGASFVGMSSSEKMPQETMIGLAGVFFGLIFIASGPYFGGVGGKLGTIAFASVLSVIGIRLMLLRVFHHAGT